MCLQAGVEVARYAKLLLLDCSDASDSRPVCDSRGNCAAEWTDFSSKLAGDWCNPCLRIANWARSCTMKIVLCYVVGLKRKSHDRLTN